MINKAILLGRLTRDPELRHTDSGKSVCNFNVAIDNGYGDNKSTDFINCVAWNKTAEFVDKYFAKGKCVETDYSRSRIFAKYALTLCRLFQRYRQKPRLLTSKRAGRAPKSGKTEPTGEVFAEGGATA